MSTYDILIVFASFILLALLLRWLDEWLCEYRWRKYKNKLIDEARAKHRASHYTPPRPVMRDVTIRDCLKHPSTDGRK